MVINCWVPRKVSCAAPRLHSLTIHLHPFLRLSGLGLQPLACGSEVLCSITRPNIPLQNISNEKVFEPETNLFPLFQFPTSGQWYDGISALSPIFVSSQPGPDSDSPVSEPVRKSFSYLSAFTEIEMRLDFLVELELCH